MEIVISYAFAHIVEAIILWMSMSQMYERRYKNWITGLIMLSGHAVMFGVFLTDNIYDVTTVNNVVYFLLIAWLFNISKKVAVFWALIYNAMMALSELTVFYIIQYLVGVCDVKGNGVVTNIIVVCLCKTIFFLFIQVMVLIKNRSNVGKDLYKDDLPIVLFIVSLISSLMVFITYYVVGMNSLISQTEAVCMVMSMIILILADILVLFVNIKVNERNAENAMIKIQLEKERADARYYKLEYEKNESLEILRHDMNNHLNTMLDIGSDNELKKYIIDIMNQYKMRRRTSFSNSNILNGLVSQYMESCEKNNIDLIADIRPDTVEVMDSTDIVALFGNLLSNAFEAAEYCKKDIKPYIEFIVKRKNDFIIIIVRNSAVKAPRKINGRYISSKKDTEKKHGYGMKSIYNIVDKYKGSHIEEYDETKREFTIKIILLNEKNIA